MKVDAPTDLDGRLILCEQRAHMIGTALEALATSELQDPDKDTRS
jgi:hypothetical protein